MIQTKQEKAKMIHLHFSPQENVIKPHLSP